MKLEVVTLGALLHDIGKFYQRGVSEEELKKRKEEAKGLRHEDFSEDFLNENKKLLSFLLGEEISEETLNFLKAAAQCHHLSKRENGKWVRKERCFELLKNEEIGRYIKVIEKADNLSAGLERVEVEKSDFRSYGGLIEEDGKDYRTKTLLPIFCLVRPGERITDIEGKDRAWGYKFKVLNTKNCFPEELSPRKENSYPDGDRQRDYRELWKSFKKELEGLLKLEELKGEGGVLDFNFKYEALKYLLIKYTWCIPSYTYAFSKGKVPISDIPLADHLLTTAAIATALARYEEDTGWKHKEEKQKEKFILMSLDFSGIQSFVFRPPKETRKWAAKILRARSFLVSLALETVVRKVIEEFKVNISSVLLNAAGKVWLLLPNVDVEKRLEKVRKKLREELLKDPFYGEVKIRFAYVTMSEEDFSLRKFSEKIEELQKKEAEEKFTLFDIEKLNRLHDEKKSFKDYYKKLSDEEDKKRPCIVCGVSPRKTDKGLCKLCDRLVKIGKKLPNSRYMRVWFSPIKLELSPFPTLIPEKKEELPENFEIAFFKNKEELKESLEKVPLRENEVIYAFEELSEESEKDRIVLPVKFLENYVPTTELDLEVEKLRKQGESDKAKELEYCYDEEIRSEVKENGEPIPKNFCHLAHEAEKGPPYLGVLKADVDRLGFIFSKGFAKVPRDGGDDYSSLSVSRVVALSRMLDFFFNAVVKELVKKEVKDLYSVFAGGDDLFLIGPWDKVIEFETKLREAFEKFTCYNKHFTISVGIEIVKPTLPLTLIAELSERALGRAKKKRNTTCIFGKRVFYGKGRVATLKELVDKADELEKLLEDDKGSSFLYKLYYLSRLANGEFDDEGKECKEDRAKKISLERFLWRPRLRYLVWRKFKEEKRYEVLSTLEKMIRELAEDVTECEKDKKDNLFYIPFAIAVYRRRR
ncbi:CRISPR-associated protein Csm1 [Phorcysia thermohydrogeniphila]|uniref:CRISPR system single-strand-specific deoxyribonuclease Cas10/Csm1 (subtype III-A) n=2 Tax=Phorcysia thermohydrogeniphila TaxID=936138 RepID=A0A4R1GE80_9BACT|nr:type III-A CRISPR-associated protein Cas10/Csm1 [Phorcysia thermohydrogeniphila]TCK06218.1 CRISPR-associated protein Csm1 [Phorcysia thermohydrogeniphila]